MKNKEKIEDFEKAKIELEDEMINNIFKYLQNGEFPKTKSDGYMNSYYIVQTLTDSGDKASAKLLKYHNSVIENFVRYCHEKLIYDPGDLINSFLKYTENIYNLIYWMNKIFCYLDRFYTKAKTKISLGKGSLSLYNEYFFKKFKKEVFVEVNKLIKLDRSGNKDYRITIRKIMKIFRDLDLDDPKIMKENNQIFWIGENNTGEKGIPEVQNEWFDNYFKEETIKFTENKAQKEIQKTTPEYVVLQLQYLDEEYERQREFIGPKYKDKINEINYKYLIGNVMGELAQKETGIKKMFGDKKEGQNIEQLSNLYKLFKLYPESLEEIKKEFKPYIELRGQKINEDKELSKDPKKFIPELISLNKEMDNLINKCFEYNSIFTNVKNDAFKTFMKKDFYPKQLANYVDFCIRKGFKSKTDEEIENTLKDIIGLFKHLESKLLFQTESDKKMSGRLIKKASLSMKTEQMLITLLKQEEGITFVSKMQEMISDLENNKKEIDGYKVSESKGSPNGIKLDVTVVSQQAWDINKKNIKEIKLPLFLSSALGDFETYYLKRHQEQKLLWCLGLSTIEIQYLYLNNKNISISTLPQFLSLLEIEKNRKINIAKIAENLEMNVKELLTEIQGLVFNISFNTKGQADKGIILKVSNPKSKEFTEADEIIINTNFIPPRLKINTIPMPKKKTENEIKEEEENDANIQKRYKDHIIQATITRIMKSRIGNITSHNWLIGETAKQISLFQAQPPMIKISIEKLIEKNIIKRNQKKSNCYDYIA